MAAIVALFMVLFLAKKSINSLVLMAIYYLKKNMGLSASFID
ncbi:hypothetical protein [Acinetobacter baumannii]|nr:hypothetical protein [Acinetobacter baumannii]